MSLVRIPVKGGLVALVDPIDAHLSMAKWYVAYSGRGRIPYVVRQGARLNGKQKLVYLHHAIVGQPLSRAMHVDHINGDSLDNRRSNLRIVSCRENLWNTRAQRDGKTSSRFIGVCWSARDKKWLSQIYIQGKNKHLGQFDKECAAAEAYHAALQAIGRPVPLRNLRLMEESL